jgi:large subunit ribosomal protein L17
MRHRVVKKTLGRDGDHRKSLLSNLYSELIDKEKINTTLAKAKFLKPKIERLITKAIKAHKSEDKILKFNIVKSLKQDIRSEEVIRKLIDNIAPKFSNRKGGYTKIIKTGNRDGDNSLTARIELVSSLEETKEKLKKKVTKKDENKSK